MKLVTVSQMQAIEKEADAYGLTYDQMMENAGHGLADAILEFFTDEEELSAVGLIGPGNNGGDALIALTALVQEGWKAHAFLVKRKKDDLVKAFTEAGGELISTSKDDTFTNLAEAIESADVLLDGVLGTGIKLPLKKEVAEVLAEVNDILDGMDEIPLVVAVDCPSGVDCDSGEAADETIPADVTVTMAAVKWRLSNRGWSKSPLMNTWASCKSWILVCPMCSSHTTIYKLKLRKKILLPCCCQSVRLTRIKVHMAQP